MLSFLKNKKVKSGLVGISISPQALAFAHIGSGPDARRLYACGTQPLADSDRAQALEELVHNQGLRDSRCNYVLDSGDYNLLLVEAPKVRPEEMAAALRWKVKDLIDWPVEDAAIDLFPVPEDAYRSQTGMVYAVVTRKSRIIAARDLLEAAGLRLEAIDIPELVMRNVSSIYTDDSNGLAFLNLKSGGSTLNLCKDGLIYLTRRLNTPIPQDIRSQDWETLSERLLLEIQRSLDYYESQMGQGQIARLLLAPRGDDFQALHAALRAALSVRVESMDLSSHLRGAENLSLAGQQSCLLAIGAALRGERADRRAAA